MIQVERGKRRRQRARVNVAEFNAKVLPARAGRSRPALFTFADVPRDRWEAAFGAWTPETFRAAKTVQDAARKAGRATTPRAAAPAVHGDCKGPGRRLYRGFDYGLGQRIEGRTHRREVMRQLGVRALA